MLSTSVNLFTGVYLDIRMIIYNISLLVRSLMYTDSDTVPRYGNVHAAEVRSG